MMSLVKIMAHLFRSYVISRKWLQAVEKSPDFLTSLKCYLACILINLSH